MVQSKPNLEPVPVVGAGVVINDAFNTGLSNQQKILDYSADIAADVLMLQRGLKPAGTFDIGPVSDAGIFTYSASPNSAGYNATPTKLGNTLTIAGFPDSSGKVASCWITPTRKIIINPAVVLGVSTNSATTATWRWTIVDYTNGIPAITSTGTFPGAYNIASAAGNVYTAWIEHAGTAACRIRTMCISGGTLASYSACLHTLVIDSSSGNVTVATDASYASTLQAANGSNVSFTLTMGGAHRQKAWLVGTYGIFMPCLVPHADFMGGVRTKVGGILVERALNSTYQDTFETLPGQISTNSWSFDRLTSDLFVGLSDGYRPGVSGAYGRLTLTHLNDVTRGAAQAVTLPNAVAGNCRLGALSSTLIVAGWTTGSQYASYLFQRSATNSLDLTGAMTITGIMGTVPADILPFSPTKAVLVTKGTGWLAQLTTVSCDTTVAGTASPFTQTAQTPQFALGQNIASAVSTDAVAIAECSQPPGVSDSLTIVSWNSTHSALGLDAFALVAA